MSSRQEKQSIEDASSISNRAQLEVIKDRNNKITTILEGVINNITKLHVAMESNNEDNQRAMKAIRRETNTTLE